MGISAMLTDVKDHLEHGAELVASHIPALIDWAQKAEADPLVATAIDLAVPPETRTMLAALLRSVEAEVQRVEADAAAAVPALTAEPDPAPAPA
jgi:hypothetical protein